MRSILHDRLTIPRPFAPGKLPVMTSSSAAIVPITLTVNDRTGLTLYAPPWEDEDGEEWQGFLGDGAKILLYPSAAELAAFIASGEENDLSDHPGYGQILRSTPDDLRPGSEDHYDLDLVYEWAAGDPDPVHVSSLANVVDMVARIADCCDDGALRRLVEGTPAYADLVDEENSYQGKDGRKRWNELGDTIADSWERAINRVESWLNWQGDYTESEFGELADAEPVVPAAPRPRTPLTRCGTASAPSRSRSSSPTRPTSPSAATCSPTPTAKRRVRPSSAPTTPSRSSPRSPTSRTTAARPRSTGWSSWSGGPSSPTSRTTTSSSPPRTPSSTCASRRPKAPDLVRELAEFCGLEADLEVLDDAACRPRRLAGAGRRGRHLPGPRGLTPGGRRVQLRGPRGCGRSSGRISGAAVRTSSAAGSSARDCDSRSAATRAA